MNDTEEELMLGELVKRAIHSHSTGSPRSQQQKNFLIGVSDLGTCPERTRRLVAQIPPTDDPPKFAAFLGTAIGRELESAIVAQHPEAIIQAEVETELIGEGNVYRITGHPDVVMPWGVMDGKTVDGLEVTRREGPTNQQLFQRHIYTKAASEAGLLRVPLEQAKTANVWLDRSGGTDEVLVHMDDYQPEIVAAAGAWLDDVMYHYSIDQPAMKVPPRQWCEAACEHFTGCRLYDSDVEGLITDESLLTAISVYTDGHQMETRGKAMKRDAKAKLLGIEGYTREVQIRWTHVNSSEVAASVRAPHDRISITPLRKATS